MKLYRWLLRLYPARFREEYAAPLARQFADEYREAQGAGARAILWLRALADLAMSIPAQFARESQQDLKYAARVYRRRLWLTTLAISALALAIGVTTGVFSVVNALLIRSLPFRDPGRLVETGYFIESRQQMYDWRNSSPYLQDVAAYSTAEMNLSRTGAAARVHVAETSSGFFALLGIKPELGRMFRAEEDLPANDGVTVIGYGLWQQMFGGDPRMLGATIQINGTALTVIGVAPPGFDYPAHTALWTPTFFDMPKLGKAGAILCETIGRLRPAATEAQARAIFQAELHREYPDEPLASFPRWTTLQSQLAGPIGQASLVLLGIMAFVLLIACANVAHLLLSRTAERRQEMAIRAALGASRARLTQQLITESVALTLAAAVAGLAVAHWSARLVSSVQPAQISAQQYGVLDGRVLGFAIAVALLTGLLFGILPAWLMSRAQPVVDSVRAQPGAGSGGVGRARVALIAIQAGCTVVLLAGSLTMGRTFLRLLGTDLGLRTRNVATVSVSLLGSRHEGHGREMQYYRRALESLRAVPGVDAVGGVNYLPLGAQNLMLFAVALDSGARQKAVPVSVTPQYFASIGAKLIDGRDFTEADRERSEPVAIVSEEFARHEDAARLIGRMVTTPYLDKPARIVGVVRSVRFAPNWSLAQFYLPAAQHPPGYMTFVAHVHGNPERYLAICRDRIQQVDPQVPVYDAMTLDARLQRALAKPRFYTTAILVFGGFSLLLALIGIYGVASYAISARTHEIGVRIAVGASPTRLRFALLRQTMLPMAVGLAFGVAGASELGRFLEHLISGGVPVDAPTCASAALLLAITAAAAAWTATARVLRIDPMSALRAE
ncbi:MAG TPA: ABC transporter permease [Bryobacteraceae bacterium]|nr:ABC transporter permease [Bryobacteraceae bacterium]